MNTRAEVKLTMTLEINSDEAARLVVLSTGDRSLRRVYDACRYLLEGRRAALAAAEKATRPEDQAVLDTPVAKLEFSVRVEKALSRLGIYTVADLMRAGEEGLDGASNFGKVSMEEVRTKLAELGLRLRGYYERGA